MALMQIETSRLMKHCRNPEIDLFICVYFLYDSGDTVNQ